MASLAYSPLLACLLMLLRLGPSRLDCFYPLLLQLDTLLLLDMLFALTGCLLILLRDCTRVSILAPFSMLTDAF